MENYKVKESDLIGDLAGIPIEIAQYLVDEQVRQGNKADVTVFQKDILINKNYGGFSWDECEFGWNTMNDIIDNKNFDLFFEKYPKEKKLPRLMRVWGDNGVVKEIRVVWGIAPNGLYLSFYDCDTMEKYNKIVENKKNTYLFTWKYAEEIEEVKELTKEEAEKELTKLFNLKTVIK